MTELEAKAKDCIENHTHKLVDKPTKQDIYLREESIFISGYKLGATENGIQWHKIADGKLPELDEKVWVIRNANDDIPMVAKRHIYTCYGRTEWEWKCYWGSGFDLKQNEIFAWCEIPQFKE